MNPMTGIELEQYEAKARSKLEAIGFEMAGPSGLWATVNGAFLIDFSAIDPDKYLIHAAKEIYRRGYADGRAELRDALRDLVNVN